MKNHEDKQFQVLSSSVDWIIFTLAVFVLIGSSIIYFWLPQLKINQVWIDFFQGIITSLIPVLILFILSFLLYRRVEQVRGERETRALEQKITKGLSNQLEIALKEIIRQEVINIRSDYEISKLAEQIAHQQNLLLDTPEQQNSPNPLRLAETRDEITELNKELVLSAENVVASFSGDLSWVQSCWDEVEYATNKTVKIQVLCKDPIKEDAKKLVEQFYYRQAVEIKYYPYDFIPKFRGMMIDKPSCRRAIFFKKEHKSLGQNYERGTGNQGNTDTHNYWIYDYKRQEELEFSEPSSALFDILWERGLTADVLENNVSDEAIVSNALVGIEQYVSAEISFESDVKVANLRPLHSYIDTNEYEKVSNLAKRYAWHNLDLWNIISIKSNRYRKIICPPIIEIHNDEWIVVDGLARAYYARELGRTNITACVIRNVSSPLVGTPGHWSQVQFTKEKHIEKSVNFRDLNMDNWRRLDNLHRALSNLLTN